MLCTSFPLYPIAATDDGSAGADGPDGTYYYVNYDDAE